MSEVAIRNQLVKHIAELENDAKLLSECINICQDYSVSGENFAFIWESLVFDSTSVARGVQRPLFTSVHAESIKKKLVDDLNAKRLKEQKEQAIAQRRSIAMTNMMRKNTKNTILRPGSKLAAPSVLFKGPIDDKKQRYRYMYEKVSERSELLDERIDEFGELIREYYNIDDLGDPSSTSEEDIITVGRICNDADASGPSAKLTEGTILLESSRMIGSGARVPLRFSTSLKLRGTPEGAGSIGLFPGAIVALRGRNGGGGMFVVEEILALPPLAPSPEPSSHRAFTMAVACGPYTSDADLEYKYFSSLMEKLCSSRPSVLVLLGPFIDAMHPFLKSGDIDQTPSGIFNQCFVKPISTFLNTSPESLILLEPSIRDILSDHPVYPQCEFENKLLADPRIKMIPNPCRFAINDVSFASSSVDVLFHLRNQEYAQRGMPVEPVPPVSPVSPESSGTDLLTNTCRHLLSQRSFYPLFPVPADLSADVNLDVSHSDGLRLDPSVEEHAPDVLLLPSKLKQFTKLVDRTWAVNPSFLTKGTYASISVPDTPRAELRSVMRCEIMRL